MATLIHPTETHFDGVFLLGPEHLKRLDEIMEGHWQILEARRRVKIVALSEKFFAEEVKRYRELGGLFNKLDYEDEADTSTGQGPSNENLAQDQMQRVDADHHRMRENAEDRASERYPLSQSQNSLSIHYHNGKKIIASSFADAMNNQGARHDTPTGFSWVMESDDIRASVSLSENRLRLSVSPEGSEDAGRVFMPLLDWVESVAPSIPLRLWKKFSGLQWMLAPAIAMILAALAINIGTVNPAATQARDLLRLGVTNQNLPKAVETLLMLSTETGSPRIRVSHIYIYLFLFYLLFSVLISFVPRTSIALGKGKRQVKIWTWWSNAMMVVVPIYVISNVVAPFLLEKINALVH